MKLYEGMFLMDSALAGSGWPDLEKHIHDILTRHKAELLYSEKWPDRRLAYEIKGCKKGTYYLTYFKAPPTSIREITRDVQLSERILRVLIVQDKGLETEMIRRKNREIEIPPADLSFPQDRPSFDTRGRFQRGEHERFEPGGYHERPDRGHSSEARHADRSGLGRTEGGLGSD
ncbi:MAG: 30S ribosomal protein S6 [Planctomycetes bacterium]|nr:30S ribosomal protein S6 [Planctomycetota bacterium]